MKVSLLIKQKKFLSSILDEPYQVKRGANLFYQISLDNNLRLNVDITNPTRGNSGFQTDLCIFESKKCEEKDILIPRVAIEFKTSATTHDIITYSAKAGRHKQIYPYLRYGMICSDETSVPQKLFMHNDSLDFYAALSGIEGNELSKFLKEFLKQEIETSKLLEDIASSPQKSRIFRNEIKICDVE